MILLAFPMMLQGQSRGKIKELGIKSLTVQEYFLEESKDKYVVELEESYDRNGRLIEIKEYNSRSEVKKWEKYVYNDDGDLVEEIFLDARGKVLRREKTVYEGDLRVEKLFYDEKDRLVKRKKYVYSYYK